MRTDTRTPPPSAPTPTQRSNPSSPRNSGRSSNNFAPSARPRAAAKRRNTHMNRRKFIHSLSLLPLSGLAFAAPQAAKKKSAALKVSLNAYSFNKLLNDAIRGRGEGVTLMQLLDFCAKTKVDRCDAT